MQKKQTGFTLIEILVVIGILAILLAIVLVAINPRQQFQQANNVTRKHDVSAILNAISSYSAKNKGQLPPTLSAVSTATEIGDGTGEIDLCANLVPEFIADLPVDPVSGTRSATPCNGSSVTYSTGYTVAVSATNSRVTIAAPDAENGETISVTR